MTSAVVAHRGSPLQDRNILVTGGAGAFGKAFVQRALQDGARRVVVFSRSESRQAEMRVEIDDPRLRYFIGDCRDQQRLVQAMRGVDLVIHSAALKRVEVCEADPQEAVATNVHGTQAVALAAIECGVHQAVLLSTDKAAAPNTLYGATKLTAERLWTAMNATHAAGTSTRFSSTRYGNVIGSTGSVVPLWKAQAARYEALTITDRRMTRFLMTMEDAVNLVGRAVRDMKGGELFVPEIRAARMVDLAEAVAPGAMLKAVGIRPGEKLHETLITDDEARGMVDAGDGVWVVNPLASSSDAFNPPAYRSDLAEKFSVGELRSLVAA